MDTSNCSMIQVLVYQIVLIAGQTYETHNGPHDIPPFFSSCQGIFIDVFDLCMYFYVDLQSAK